MGGLQGILHPVVKRVDAHLLSVAAWVPQPCLARLGRLAELVLRKFRGDGGFERTCKWRRWLRGDGGFVTTVAPDVLPSCSDMENLGAVAAPFGTCAGFSAFGFRVSVVVGPQ
mmetsp:Transcript_16462/g.45606  ORF Transcript_16462/g.45606 Transcript_16462/m.45606 type:complete len:113 (-) Transcript_16462:77-415(-)